MAVKIVAASNLLVWMVHLFILIFPLALKDIYNRRKPNHFDMPELDDSVFAEDPGRRLTIEETDYYEQLKIFMVSFCYLSVCFIHLILQNAAMPTRYPLVLLIGWVAGKFLETYVFHPQNSLVADIIPHLYLRIMMPIIFYLVTLHVDYHTFSRSMGQIIAASVPAFASHCFLVTAIVYPILKRYDHWTVIDVFLLVALLSSVLAESTIAELKKVHGQLRQLHLLLQGETVVSIVMMAFITPILFKYHNPLNIATPKGEEVMAYIGWLIFSLLPAVFIGLFYRYLLSLAYSDLNCQAALALVTISFCFWFAEFLGAGGPLSVVCFGITTGCAKLKYSSEAEKFFSLFWVAMSVIVKDLVVVVTGLILGASPHILNNVDYGFIFIFYGLIMISRTLSMAIMGIIYIARSGWIAWKHYIVALWGVYKGTPSLVLACYVFLELRCSFSYEAIEPLAAIRADHYLDYTLKRGESLLAVRDPKIVLYTTCVTLISVFINVTALAQLLRALGMHDLSQTRLMNMDTAVVQVNHCREKAIMALKMDRVIADANWLVVDQTTKLPHPYSRILSDSEVDTNDENTHARVIVCSECNAESVAPLTKKELIDLTLEAKHRILKAQMMSFWKQSEHGTLSGHGYRFLVNLIEMASVRDDPLLSLKDLKIQREGSPSLRKFKAFFGYLYTITSTTHRFIPTNWLRALCFRMCTSRTAQICMAFVSLIDLALLINFLIMYYFNYDAEVNNGTNTKYKVYQMCDTIFFSIFFLEFCTLLLGIGVVQYFQSNVNKIEFATGIIMRPLELIMVADSKYRLGIDNLFLVDKCAIFVKTMLLLRFARIYIFIVALIPKLLNLVDRKMDDDLIKSYDVGKAYIIALDKVIKFLGYIVENEVVFNQLTEYEENERRIVTRELGLIQKDRPTIAITIKTRHAVRHVINTMNGCVEEMKEEGMLDWSENQTLISALLTVKKRTRSLILVCPSNPDTIVRQIPWLHADYETCNFFSEHAMLSTYAINDTIIHYGDDPYGLFVLVSGLVHCFYQPSDTTTYVSFGMAKTHGVLPNYDFFINHLKIEAPQEEYIVGGGNLIGELGVLTGRKYDMIVTCETSVQLYYIPWTIIQAVVHDSSNAPIIQARLWKATAIKIGVNLLPYTSRFQGWSREKLLLYLQRGVVPVLDDITVINVNNEVVEDLFLIEGVAMDMTTRSIFYGPVMIPRTIQKLLLPESPLWDHSTNYKTQLLVIPCPNAYIEDVMGPEGIFKGNSKGVDPNENDLGEEDDEEEDEIEDREDSSTEICRNQKHLISPEMLLKLKRKRNRRVAFLEYIPTLSGPIEGNIASTTFIIKTSRGKAIRTVQHTRTVKSSIPYTQDIEEMSEIGLPKELIDDDTSRTSSKIAKKNKSYISIDRTSSSRFSQLSHVKHSDVPKKIELLVIDSGSDEYDSDNVKFAQTSVQMRPNLPRKSMNPIAFEVTRHEQSLLSESADSSYY